MHVYVCFIKPTFILAYFDRFSNTNYPWGIFLCEWWWHKRGHGAFFPCLKLDPSIFPLLKDKWQKSAILVKVLDFCQLPNTFYPVDVPLLSQYFTVVYFDFFRIISINFIWFSSSIKYQKERQNQGVQRA